MCYRGNTETKTIHVTTMAGLIGYYIENFMQVAHAHMVCIVSGTPECIDTHLQDRVSTSK